MFIDIMVENTELSQHHNTITHFKNDKYTNRNPTKYHEEHSRSH